MVKWIILGLFFLIFISTFIGILRVRRRIRKFSQEVFGQADLLSALQSVDSVEAQSPRSLNGCDSLLLPQILRDFPDFDVTTAKSRVRNRLNQKFSVKSNFTIYNVVITRYLRSSVHKTIVFQAAVSWESNDETVQKRFDVHYTFAPATTAETVATNCPNCGAALGYGDVECAYCNSRVVNVMGNAWEFTEILET